MKKKIIWTLIILTTILVFYWAEHQLGQALAKSAQKQEQEWSDYKTRCEELGGLASRRFTGYDCAR